MLSQAGQTAVTANDGLVSNSLDTGSQQSVGQGLVSSQVQVGVQDQVLAEVLVLGLRYDGYGPERQRHHHRRQPGPPGSAGRGVRLRPSLSSGLNDLAAGSNVLSIGEGGADTGVLLNQDSFPYRRITYIKLCFCYYYV